MSYFTDRYYKHPFFGKPFFVNNDFFDIPYSHLAHALALNPNAISGFFTKAVTGTMFLDDVHVFVNGVYNPVTAINMVDGETSGSIELTNPIPAGAHVTITIHENDQNNMGFVKDYNVSNQVTAAKRPRRASAKSTTK
jgi:hypothetical protein